MKTTSHAFLALLLVVLSAFPIWQYLKVAEMVSGFEPETGTVLRHVETQSASTWNRGQTVIAFNAVISYPGLNGETKEFTSIVSRTPATPVGSKVQILVEPLRRNSAYEAGAMGIWLGVTVASAISLGVWLLVALGFYLRRKKSA